ncbi:MAG TPA: hypothetical protein VGQ83_27325 [Polyangia bacterium]|jgi:hypothetical protein
MRVETWPPRTEPLLRTLAAAALLAGCGGGAEGIGGHPSGAGGGGTTAPECGALGQACISQGLDAPLVLGGRYELAVGSQIAGSSGPPVTLEVADPTVLTATESGVEAVGAGASAVLFIGPDETVLDFIHLWVVAAEELRIMRYAPTGVLLGRVQAQVQLLAGDEVLVAVEPYTNAQPLMGNFELLHSVTGDAVAIVPDSVAAWYRVVARAPGSATVTFSGLGLEERWEIEVLP